MKLLICIFVIVSGFFSINMNKMHLYQPEDRIVYKMVAKESFKDGEPVKVHFTLENRSDKTMYFLKWYTPFEGINSDMFKITRNGVEIQYEGRMVKRGNPGFEDYLLINPGTSVDTTVDLSSAYNMKETGEYRVEFRGKIYDFIYTAGAKAAEKLLPRPTDKHKMIDIPGNSLSIRVSKF